MPTSGKSYAENRLIAVVIVATGHRSEFGYDGLGRRVEIIEKDANVITSDKTYLWDGVEIAEERDATGGIVQKRFYSQGFVDTDGTILFYTRDHLGSIRELTDSTQAVRARYDYDPYGRMTKVQGDRDSQFTYTGHFWHAQSGLDLTLYRAYDPNLRRWLSRDPAEEIDGSNLYTYVSNNPIIKIDAYGLCSWGPPSPVSDGICDKYPDCYVYKPKEFPKALPGASAKKFCKCMGDDPWSQCVRTCLYTLYLSGVDPDTAHKLCYYTVSREYIIPVWKIPKCYMESRQ